jgi:hypothetical protein
MTLLLAAVLALAVQDVTKDDVVRLTKEGISQDVILKKIGSAKFALSVDEIVELKKAGVGEKVLARMVSGPSELRLENLSHRGVKLSIEGSNIVVGLGDQYPSGTRVELPASGEFTVWIPGRRNSTTLRTPATLTVRGCNLEKFEVVTLYIESPAGLDTAFLDLNIRPEPEPAYVVPVGPPAGSSRIMHGGFLDRLWDCVGNLGSIF